MSHVEKKVQRIVALRTETPEMREALATVSELWSGDTAETRRNLRADLERRNVELAEAFVRAFAPVKRALGDVDAKSELLERHAASMLAEVKSADAQARRLVAAYDALATRRATVADRLGAVEAFERRFHLSAAEAEALKEGSIDDGGGGGGDAFFAALDRAARAREECATALRARDTTTAGGGTSDASLMPEGAEAFELLENLQVAHDSALERLFEWTLATLGGGAEEEGDHAAQATRRIRASIAAERSAADSKSALRQALRVLRPRRPMVEACEAVGVAARKDLVRRRFELGLATMATSMEEEEEVVQDSSRFVSDMLAWAHEAVASEFEIARLLFFDEEPDAKRERALVGAVVDSIADPLKARVAAALGRCGADVAALHKLAQLLRFYAATFGKLKKTSQLPAVVFNCADEAARARDSLLDALGAKFEAASAVALVAESHPVSPLALQAAAIVRLLREADTALSVSESSLDDLVDRTLRPVLAACDRCLEAAPQRRTFRASRSSVDYVGEASSSANHNQDARDVALTPACTPQAAGAACANNAQVARRSLAPHASKAELDLAHAFDALIHRGIDAAARHEAANQLARAGLDEVLEWVRRFRILQGQGDEKGTASPTMMTTTTTTMTAVSSRRCADDVDGPALGAALRTFYSSLFSLSMPELDALADPNLRDEARTKTATLLADAHEAIYKVASDPAVGGYADTAFLVHSPQQVRVLLDCD